MSKKKRIIRVTPDVYDAAERLLSVAGPVYSMALVEAGQEAEKCAQKRDEKGVEFWQAVSALIVGSAGDLSSDVEVIGRSLPGDD